VASSLYTIAILLQKFQNCELAQRKVGRVLLSSGSFQKEEKAATEAIMLNPFTRIENARRKD
jgi:hypothetical protein